MSRPLVVPCLGTCLGICLGDFGCPDPVWLGGLVGAAWVAIVLCRPARRWLMPLGFLGGGWLLLVALRLPMREQDLRAITDPRGELVTVQGALTEAPTVKMAGDPRQPRWRTRVALRVVRVRREGRTSWEPGWGEVICSLPGTLGPGFYRTREVEVHGVLREPDGPRAPGLFDARWFYSVQGIWRQLDTDAPADWTVLNPEGHGESMPWSERFLPWARSKLSAGLPDDEATRLLAAMALGWKTPLTGEIDDVFMESGTLHVFAISGLHIALIAGLLVQGLRLFRLSRGTAGLIAVPCLWFYVVATGWQASAIRSALMTTVIVFGWALERPSDLLNSLAGAALLILIPDPGQLFQAGFQLSFGAVAGLAVLAPGFQERGLKWLLPRRDPFLPASLQPNWIRWVEPPIRMITAALATGLAAGLSTLPLVCHFFHLVSPISVLANLLVVPLSSLALAAEFGSLVSGLIWPWLGEVFNGSAWVWMKLMVWVGRGSATLPGGHFWVSTPDWWWWIPYYGLLVAWSQGAWNEVWGRRTWTVVFAGTLGIAGWIGCIRAAWLELVLLDRGQALWIGPGWQTRSMLIDAGSRTDASAIIIPFLHAHGIGSLPSLILSRRDARHAGGAGVVLREVPIAHLAGSAGWSRPPEGVRFPAPGLPVYRGLVRGDRVEGWEVLHPRSGVPGAVACDSSLVLMRECAGLRLAWLADLGTQGQLQLSAQPCPSVDILLLDLPPRGEPLGDALLDRLRPRWILVAGEPAPSPRRIHPETIRRWRARGIGVISTASAGAVQVQLIPGRGAVMQTQRGFRMEVPSLSRSP